MGLAAVRKESRISDPKITMTINVFSPLVIILLSGIFDYSVPNLAIRFLKFKKRKTYPDENGRIQLINSLTSLMKFFRQAELLAYPAPGWWPGLRKENSVKSRSIIVHRT